MTITAAEFKVRFPEFDSIADARIDLFIADSVTILNESYWGEKYNLGLYYLTAHFLSLGESSAAGNVSGASGPVTGRTVDGSSVSFASPQVKDESDAFYMQTSYGQRYLALRKNLGVPACVI